ncbi:MAG: hypothetical protein P1S46_00040 [bacterium]|nr:hypothetical protein [bacterium]MDT8396214.1 hypothetical protein [bacterium]
MSFSTYFRMLPLLSISLLLAAGCATPIPPSYSMSGQQPDLPGPIAALAAGDGQVAAANPDGVFLKAEGKGWERLEIPGLKDPGKVTCLAFQENSLFVGTDGEGLHILSDGQWEVVSRKYSGLPGDGVLSLAVDGKDDDFPGTSLWVGTRDGFAVLREGTWIMYSPEEKWLDSLSGENMAEDEAEVYLGLGYDLVRGSRMADLFTPPVTAVAVGPDRVVFANNKSRLAVVGGGSVAVVHFYDDRAVRSIVVDENVIWAGTDRGLLWGGVSGKAAGRPWPTNYPQAQWGGSLSGTRDTRPFEYRWFQVGYSTANVSDLVRDGTALWVAHTGGSGPGLDTVPAGGTRRGADLTDPIIDLRRYLNIGEYIVRREKPVFESYGMDDGLKGDTLAVAPVPERREVWVGTERGLYRFQRPGQRP